MAASIYGTPKRTEQNLIVRIGKSDGKVTIIKDCARGIVQFCTVAANYRQVSSRAASRGLYATAELLVVLVLTMSYNFFCHATLCIARLVPWCGVRPSVCPSVRSSLSCIVLKRVNTCSIFPPLVATHFLFSQTKYYDEILEGFP